MEKHEGIGTTQALTRNEWRAQLRKNDTKKISVWLILDKEEGSVTGLAHEEATNKALCYGWIDSRPIKRHKKFIENLRDRKAIVRPEDLGISMKDATRDLLAAKAFDEITEMSGGLYVPPDQCRMRTS